MKIKILLLYALLFSSKSIACGFAPGYELPRLSSIYETDKVPVKPVVSVISIHRGSDDGNGGSCSDAGIIVLRFEDDNSINETAYRFKVFDSSFFSEIFPSDAVTYTSLERNKREMYFAWFDLGQSRPEKLDFKLQIVAVSASGKESEPELVVVSESSKNG
jgi:hypothetical protein